MTASADRHTLGVWPGFVLPDLGDVAPWVVVSEPQRTQIDDAHLDTEDLRLVRWGISLVRRRFSTDDSSGVWRLQLPPRPDNGEPRPVIERSAGATTEPPAALCDLLRAFVRTAPLVTVSMLQTVRMTVRLTDGGGRLVAEVDDDEVSVLDGDRVAARFRELTVAPAANAPGTLVDLLLARLHAAGAGEPDPAPKLVRAIGPRALAPSEIAPRPIDDGATAAQVFTAGMTAAVHRLLQHDLVVRLDEGPHGVHQARVSTRRLRSDLRTFADLLDPDYAGALRSDLTEIAGVLGRKRDADVQLARLTKAGDALGGDDAIAMRSLLRRLRVDRERYGRELDAELASDAYVSLLDRLVVAARSPRFVAGADARADVVLPAIVATQWRRLRKRVRALGKEPPDHELHETRIKVKRLRYACEVAALVVPKAQRMAERAADVQTVLGDHQDAVVAQDWIRGAIADGASAREAFAAGRLIEREGALAQRHREAFPDSWAALDRSKVTSWLPS